METSLSDFLAYRNKTMSDKSLISISEELNKIFAKEITPSFLLTEKDLVGIEVEVENIHSDILYDLENKVPYSIWKSKEDGSLRNNGIEFITIPIFGYMVSPIIKLLQDSLENKNKDYSFSKRTSVHVHINARTLSVEEVLNILFIYIAVERLLYRWVKRSVGTERANNIFCLPINQTYYSNTLGNSLKSIINYINNNDDYRAFYAYTDLVRNWKKYLGINLLRSIDESCGTIEFRHLAGTIDVKIISTWVGFLLKIKKKAKEKSLSEILEYLSSLNSNSEYEVFVDSVFGELAQELLCTNIQKHMEDNISFIKECIEYSSSIDKVHKLEEVSYNKFKTSLLNINLEKLGFKLFKETKEKANKAKVNKKILFMGENFNVNFADVDVQPVQQPRNNA